MRIWKTLLALGIVAAGTLQAQTGPATVAGTVVDSDDRVLVGARVSIDGAAATVATDRTGRFRLAGLPAGAQVLRVEYLGFTTHTQELALAAGTTTEVRARLAPAAVSETVVVEESLLDGQARALNQQRTALSITNVVAADQIGSFPDPNAAEATQRIPGVSIQRDQGEGRYVLIRGTEARLNSMLINGERIPSPEGEIRNVALDVIPADLLQSIEVSKALTPDMDADAIGGAVNLVLKEAPEKPRFNLFAAGGYNRDQESFDNLRSGFNLGRRFAEGRAGMLLSGSYYETTRGSENFEVAYDDGELDEFEVRDYVLTRKRLGLNGAFDYRLGPGSALFLTGVYNRYSDFEYRRATISDIGSSRMERELSDREEIQRIASVSGGGRHALGGGVELDYRVSWSWAEEDDTSDLDTTFRQRGVRFAPNVSAGSIDAANIQPNPLNEDLNLYRYQEGQLNSNLASDEDWVGALNLRLPLGTATPSFAGAIKFGAKLRDKSKTQNLDEFITEADGTVLLRDFVDASYAPGSILGGRYSPGAHVDPAAARSFLSAAGFSTEEGFEDEFGDFEASEQTLAGYAMAELQLGSRTLLLPGVRVERTRVDYTGKEVLFDEDGDYDGSRPVSGEDEYTIVMPGLHLRHKLDDRSNLRAAFTRTLARPNYFDLVPYELVIAEDGEIERGNSALRPTTSWNLDLMGERYLDSLGVVSAGVFYKRLTDYIYDFTFEEERGGEEFDVQQPRNGESASLFGVEFAYQNRLRFLPAPLDGLGLYANYTFTDSEAIFPGREGEAASLPGQSRHVGNLALSYEKGGFAGRVSLNFHGKYVDEVGDEAAEDVYYDDHVQLDLSLSQKFGERVRVYAELYNLTDEPLRYYEGRPDRPIQEEYYRFWAFFGVKLNF